MNLKHIFFRLLYIIKKRTLVKLNGVSYNNVDKINKYNNKTKYKIFLYRLNKGNYSLYFKTKMDILKHFFLIRYIIYKIFRTQHKKLHNIISIVDGILYFMTVETVITEFFMHISDFKTSFYGIYTGNKQRGRCVLG